VSEAPESQPDTGMTDSVPEPVDPVVGNAQTSTATISTATALPKPKTPTGGAPAITQMADSPAAVDALQATLSSASHVEPPELAPAAPMLCEDFSTGSALSAGAATAGADPMTVAPDGSWHSVSGDLTALAGGGYGDGSNGSEPAPASPCPSGGNGNAAPNALSISFGTPYAIQSSLSWTGSDTIQTYASQLAIGESANLSILQFLIEDHPD